MFRLGKVGHWCDIRKGMIVNNPSKIAIGDYVRIDRDSRLSCFSMGGILIEDGCSIGQHFSAIAGGDICIKKNTLIASYVAIVAENHGMDPEYGKPYSHQPLVKQDVVIGENCWIGEKVVVLPGVTIGDWCVIGACSVVNKDVPPYSVAVGNPAKVIKRYNFETHSWVSIK